MICESQDNKIYREFTNKNGEVNKLFEVLPNYDYKKLQVNLDDKNNLGLTIDVYQAWIATEHRPEYLVFKDYLIKELL